MQAKLSNTVPELMLSELWEKDEWYQVLLESMNDGLVVIDEKLRIAYVNERFCQIVGGSKEDLIGQAASSLHDERSRKIFEQEIDKRRKGEHNSYEIAFQCKDGRRIFARISPRPIFAEDGRFKGSFAVVTDITSRKQAEAELSAAYAQLEKRVEDRTAELMEAYQELKILNERLREYRNRASIMFDSMRDGIVTLDRTGRITSINRAITEVGGYSEEDVVGKRFSILKIFPPDSLAKISAAFAQRIKGRETPPYEVQIKTKKGDMIDLEIHGSPLKEKGKVVGAVATLRDISERKRTESALKKSEEKFRALFEHIPGIAFVIDGDTRLIAANTLRKSILGDDIGLKALERRGVSPETRKFWHAVETQVIESGWPAWYTEIVRDPDKETRYYENRLRPIKKDGKVTMVIGVAYDITQRIQAEEIVRKSEAELRRQSEHLEEVNAALNVLLKRRDEDKQELEEKVVANVKELVLPYLQRLKESGLNPQQTTMAAILESNLREIVSPFVTRLSSKFVNLTPTELKVADLIRDGRTTKEIASLLNLSHNTILFHRHNIRGKLDLKKKKTNLRSYLRSLQE